MKVAATKYFQKRYRALQPKVRAKVRERITVFEQNPFDPILDNHPLDGKYGGCRSIDITGNYRIIYELVAPDLAKLLAVGTHHELYGK